VGGHTGRTTERKRVAAHSEGSKKENRHEINKNPNKRKKCAETWRKNLWVGSAMQWKGERGVDQEGGR